MKHFFTRLSLAIVLSFAAFLPQAEASHAAGIELTYQCLGGNLYQFTLRFYRDGCGIAAPNSVTLSFTNTCGLPNPTLTMTGGVPVDVTPLCQNFLNNTCCGGGALSCFTETEYTGQVTLGPCTNWTVSYAECCRNTAIVNLQNPGSQDLYVETVLNTQGFPCNNGVEFDEPPIIYACINQQFVYNPIATDVDGDSLVFSLVNPRSAAFTNIPMVAPFTPTNPLPSTPALTLGINSGLITFTPTAPGNYVLTVRVQEFRNGQLVGSTFRDVQILVLPANLCQNISQPPLGVIDTVTGGVNTVTVTGQTFYVCSGNVISFNFTFSDPNPNEILSIFSNAAQAIPGSTLTYSGNNPVVGTFSWNTAGHGPDTLNFYVTASDGACPVPNNLTYIYEIIVAQLDASSSSYQICTNNLNTLQLNAAGLGGNAAPGTYTWTPAIGLNNTNIANPVATITQPISYTVTYQNGPCIQNDVVNIVASPYSLQFPALTDTTICDGGAANLTATLSPGAPTFTFTANTPTAIPAGGSVSIPIPVSGVFPLTYIANLLNSVTLNIAQNVTGHLNIYLVSPSGQQVMLSTGNGGFTNSGYNNVTFTPAAAQNITAFVFTAIPANSVFRPEQANGWTPLLGSTVNGNWSLLIQHSQGAANGGQNGTFNSVTLTFNNLNTPNFLWSTGGTTQTISVNPPATTTYSVTATNLFGCTDTADVTVFIETALPAPVVSCGPGTNSSVTFVWQALGGAASYSVSIDGGPFINFGNSLTYTVIGLTQGQTVTIQVIANSPPGSACGSSQPGTITCVAGTCPAIIPTISGDITLCGGQNSVLTATAGYQAYAWNNGATTPSITVNGVGLVLVTVTDASGCTGTASVNVTLAAPTVAITGDGQICTGETSTISATAGYASYAWSTGESTSSITVNAANTYAVTITDAGGCTGSANFALAVSTLPTPIITGSTTICNGASSLLDAGAFAAYTWSTGATSQTITATQAGAVSVSVTDAFGCTGSTTVTISLAANLSPTIGANGPTSFCQGGSVVLDAGNFGGFAWSNGATGQNITVNATGTYSVTVSEPNGCTGTDQLTVTVHPNPSVSLGPDFGVCQGDSATLTATVTGGTAPYTYNWNNGASTGSLALLPNATGSFGVTVTDANTCTAVDQLTLTVNNNPVADAGNDRTICNGATTTLVASASGAAGPFTYTWGAPLGNNGASQTVNPGFTTTYTVTATTPAGCTGTDAVTVTVNPVLAADAGPNRSVCTNSTVLFSPFVIGGSPGYTYQWSGPGGFNSILPAPVIPAAQVLNSGTYNLTVTDALGCTASGSFSLIVSNSLFVNIVPNGNPIFCAGGTLALDAGIFDNYQWSTGETAQTIQVNATGNYSVTVSDQQGCTGTGNLNVTVNPLPTASAGSDQSICAGESVVLAPTATGGTAPFSFNWGPGQTGTIVVSPTNNQSYTVTVTDVNGCTAFDQVNINVNPNPGVSLGPDSLICLNATITLNAIGSDGLPPYTFTWGGGQTGASISEQITGPETFQVTITDFYGCTGTDEILVDTFSTLVFNILTPSGTTFCNGATLPLDAGPGFFSYLWSTGESTRTISVGGSGVYSVTVTDATVCQGVASIQVTELPTIAIGATITPVRCFGGSDGRINLTGQITGGTGNYVSYVWSAGAAAGPVATGLSAGSVSVTVTDDLGCTGSAQFQVGQPNTATNMAIVSANATCNGAANGVAIANPFGGTPGYTFLWSNGEINDTVSNLLANTPYFVTVTDAVGCTATASVTVGQPTPLVLAITGVQPTDCYNSADGNATVVASGGVPGYVYQWSNGETTASAIYLTAGTRTVVVGDNQGCTASASVNIVQPSPVTATLVSVTAPNCNGQNTGTIRVTGAGGTGPYTYQWGTAAAFQTSPLAINLAAGPYGVTITDFNGCTGTGVFVVPNTSTLALETQRTATILCYGDSTGAIRAFASGGNLPYQYLWSNGETVMLIDSLPSDTFTVTVTDAAGCTVSATRFLSQPQELVATGTVTDVNCNGGFDGAISVSATGGTMPYRYQLDNGPYRIGSTFSGLPADSFRVVVRDNFYCTDTLELEVLEPDSLIASLLPQDTSIEYGESVVLTITANSPVTYEWVPDTTLSCLDCAAPIATPYLSTVYEVIVSDSNGCEVMLEANVTVFQQRRAYVANLFTPNGDGANDIFLVQGGRGVQAVRTFRVFDRWGELVYEAIDVLPNDIAGGWDGKFKGKQMNSGVFVWYAEIEYTDGYVETLRGDVTLVR